MDRDRGRHPPCPRPWRDRAPGRGMDGPAGPEPADGPRESATRFRFLVRDRAGQFTEAFDTVLTGAGIEVVRNPAAQPEGERLFRAVGAHRPVRGHRPNADRRAAAPAAGPEGVRRAFQPASPAPGQEPAASGRRRHHQSPGYRLGDGPDATPRSPRWADPRVRTGCMTVSSPAVSFQVRGAVEFWNPSGKSEKRARTECNCQGRLAKGCGSLRCVNPRGKQDGRDSHARHVYFRSTWRMPAPTCGGPTGRARLAATDSCPVVGAGLGLRT